MCEIGENEYELTADRASSRINNVCHKSFSRPKAVRGSRSQKNFGICGGRRNRQETPSQKVGLPTHFSFYKNETIFALELTFCSILIMEKFQLILLYIFIVSKAHCLKITQNVAFEFLTFRHFPVFHQFWSY